MIFKKQTRKSKTVRLSYRQIELAYNNLDKIGLVDFSIKTGLLLKDILATIEPFHKTIKTKCDKINEPYIEAYARALETMSHADKELLGKNQYTFPQKLRILSLQTSNNINALLDGNFEEITFTPLRTSDFEESLSFGFIYGLSPFITD